MSSIGNPHCGQARARSDTEESHSEHLISATGPPARTRAGCCPRIRREGREIAKINHPWLPSALGRDLAKTAIDRDGALPKRLPRVSTPGGNSRERRRTPRRRQRGRILSVSRGVEGEIRVPSPG